MLNAAPLAPSGSLRTAAVVAMLGVALLVAAAPALAGTGLTLAHEDALAWSSTPPEVASSSVGVPLRVDGRTFDVREFHSSLSPGVVVERWRSWWHARAISALESSAGSWRVLAYRSGADLVTVQLRRTAAGGTEGYLSRASADARVGTGRRSASPRGLPPGASVLRTVESSDGPRIATQTVIATDSTAAGALAWLVRRAIVAGWSPALSSDHSHGAAVATRMHAGGRWFVRGDDELGIFVQAQPTGALAVVHHARARASAREEW